MAARIVAVSSRAGHGIGKDGRLSIRLLAGLGVAGDAHCGATVKHRSRVARDPGQPNLRQVHLVQAELFAELAHAGFALAPGQLGENVTTQGLDLLDLPAGTVLRLGRDAAVAITGLRNPCAQLDGLRPGLMRAVLGRDAQGRPIRKAGIMAVVERGGDVFPGDAIAVTLPPQPHRPLEPV